MADHNVFAGAFVDRIGERRKDPDWLAEALSSSETRFVPVWGDRCLVGGDPAGAVLLDADAARPFVTDDNSIFLGLFRDRPAFSVAISRDLDAPFADLGEFKDLRYLGTVLPPDEANLVAHARALVLWHDATLYCGKCGSASQPSAGGNSRRCCNPDCATEIFPRTDPAIIVLVSDGDRCLLGRQPSWPEGRYSTIAGFVEPGESLEECVTREVKEEVGICVKNIRYFGSQPWPFPNSLMVGFIADYDNGQININRSEIVEAGWFNANNLPSIPPKITIARHLIDWFVNQNMANAIHEH